MTTTRRGTRLHQPGWLAGSFHLLILGVAAESDSAAVWPWALLAMATVSFLAWTANHRRYRQIIDLPTSRIATAAQGYAELLGRAEYLDGAPVQSPLADSACCWYAWAIREKNSRGDWKTVDQGRSTAPFLLVDDSGRCTVSPEGAEVLTTDLRSWREGRREYREWLLLAGSPLYALGEFSTTSAAVVAAREEQEGLAGLLAAWKRDQPRLHERFDLDRDGRIDLREWELARLQARRELRAARAAEQAPPPGGEHSLGRPRDGRLFLLANEMPDRLGKRYRLWSWIHLGVFLGAGSAGLLLAWRP